MKKVFSICTGIYPSGATFNITMLLFRIAISAEMIGVHGLKKLGIGVPVEQVPNPLHFPEALNSALAISANLIFPLFVIAGFFTRIAILPILALTLTGYFVVHWSDPGLVKDVPYMYSVCFLLVFVFGPGKYSADRFLHKSTLK
jgi:putative oxidoreductase